MRERSKYANTFSRTPVRIARGTYSNLNSSIADIQEGEICYATDQNRCYVKGNALVSVTPDTSTLAALASPVYRSCYGTNCFCRNQHHAAGNDGVRASRGGSQSGP